MKKAAVLLTMVVMMILFVTACSAPHDRKDYLAENKSQNATTSYEENHRQPENQSNQKNQDNQHKQENQNKQENQENQGQETKKFEDQADLEGSVYDFTETGFSLSPAETYEDGNGSIMAQAAPGAEDTSKLVTITYDEDCSFQIVVMDLSSLKEVSREDTTSESIKKQTQVKVYGNCQDAIHWTAERIMIVRWQ